MWGTKINPSFICFCNYKKHLLVNTSYHLDFFVRNLANYQTDKFILIKLIICPSHPWTNLSGNSLASGYNKPLNCSQIKFMIFFFPPRDAAAFLYSRLTSVSVSDEKFLSSHSSLIYLPLSFPPSTRTHASPAPPDDPGQLKIYLPKKLLECLPKCSSLPKERHRWNTNEVRLWNTREGNIYDSETNRSPVTHLWQMSHREMKRWQKKKTQIAIADILFMTLKLWHQEIKGINPNLQENLTVAAHSVLGILLCTPNRSEFRPRNWRLRGSQIYRAWRLWKKKWGYRLNVSSVDCYLPQKALGQLDKYCYLNLPLLLWKHGKAAEIIAHSRWLKIFLFRLLWYFIYSTPCYFVLTTTFREKRGEKAAIVNTHSEDLAMKAS